MIKIQLTIKSTTLLRPVQVFAFMPHGFFPGRGSYKTIWMLHSAISDGSMFTEHARLLDFANQNNCALIAPSLGNGYFADTIYEKQASFLMAELLPAMRQTLSISSEKEDNFLLGVSMGGFGAVRWAFDMPDVFSSVAAISAYFGMPVPFDERVLKAKDLRALYQVFNKKLMPKLLFDKEGNLHSHVDLTKLMSVGSAKVKGSMPRVGLYCGDCDYLAIDQTKAFFEHCEDEGVAAEMFVSEGSHNAEYWNPVIFEAAEWLLSSK